MNFDAVSKLKFFIISLFCGFSFGAFAGLGDRETSVEPDTTTLHGEHQFSVMENNIHDHKITAGGSTIHYYVNANGDVFALTWEGRTVPNLSVVLSAFFKDYKDEMQNRPKIRGRAPLNIQTDRIKFSMFGHPGDVQGRAYIPALVPPGFDINGIK